MNEGEIDGVSKGRKNPFLFFKNKYQFLYHSVPTKKGGSIINTNKSRTNKSLFGASLEVALIEYGSRTPSRLFIPEPIYRCVHEIIRRGLHVEGIFRLSGAASEVEQLCQAFENSYSMQHHQQHPTHHDNYHLRYNNNNNVILDLSNHDIHAIASVMKKYLRCLPEPTIPAAYHHQFIQHADQMGILADLVISLPRAHFHLISFIIELASHIQQYQYINMMNPEALAVVLAPVCTGLDHRLKEIPAFAAINHKKKCSTEAAAALDQLVQANAQWTRIWTLMIENHQFFLNKWYSAINKHQDMTTSTNTAISSMTTAAASTTTPTRSSSSFKDYINNNSTETTQSLAAAAAAASQHSIMIATPQQHHHHYHQNRIPSPSSITTSPIMTSMTTNNTATTNNNIWSPPPSLPLQQQQQQQLSSEDQNNNQRKRQKNYGVVVMRRGVVRSHSPSSKSTSSIDDLDQYLLDTSPIISMFHMSTKENSYDRRRRTRSMFSPNIPPLV
ncbi:Rho GTPase activation protein [Phascolomyces articulosus]|uniref:Rho GTPase activation protein n=1 Tax=Phascolomyces articulosus TaxID=60185 RepID=A0AAD5PGE5_9FUNG|nr:Rho GTPase activation protein [Phascolomyces articulosus]